MADDLPLEHIFRAASVPWRAPQDGLTECGREVGTLPTITRDQFIAKLRTQGKQRAAFTTCMVCWETTTRYKLWSEDPLDAIRREVYGMRGDDKRFGFELHAIEMLINNHREEFDGYVQGLQETVNLADRRRARRKAH